MHLHPILGMINKQGFLLAGCDKTLNKQIGDCHGKVVEERVGFYQDDFRIPGSIPSEAISRKVIRERPNFRMNPRERPVTAHRFFKRVGLLLRGSFCNSTWSSHLVVGLSQDPRSFSLSSRRLSEWRSWSFCLRRSRASWLFFAIDSLSAWIRTNSHYLG